MELVNIVYTGPGNESGQLIPADRNLISTNYLNSSFGSPEDYMELFIYDENKNLLSSDYDAFDYYPYLLNNPKNNTYSALSLDPEKDVKNRGFNRGNLTINYNFYKKLFNSTPGNYYWIKEISTSRKELRLASQTLSSDNIRSGFSAYQSYISANNYYPIFFLNFGSNQIITANNVAYTEDDEGGYLLIKLYEPLPSEFDLKSQLWIVDKIAEPVSFNVDIQIEAEDIQNVNRLRGPNYNVYLNNKNGQTTPYYTYDNLLTSPVTSSYQKLLSYYQDRSVAINVNYSDFKNFIHFSSALERVNNFIYKIKLIESASYDISVQKSIIGGSPTLLATSSSIGVLQSKIDNIIQNFDTYEYFLYFESSSWAWPKYTNTQPYSLYSVTSSRVSNFLGNVNTVPTQTTQSLLFSASYYDATNKDILRGAIPQYLLDDSSNQPYLTFIDMIGQHFDNIWLYYKDLSNRYNASNNPNTGISLDVVADALRGFGIQLYTNSNVSDNLYYTLFGINPDGSLLPPTGSERITNYVTSSLETLSAKDIQGEFYKRLYHNLPYLLKSKGTERGVKALISTFGIPDSILTVREFGGTPINQVDGIFDLDSSNYKIAIVTGSNGNVTGSLELSGSLLSPYTSIQYYQNINRLNSNNIEVGFSPADTINSNINSSLGFFNIDQLIASPGYQYSSSYESLVSASNAYFSTYTQPNSIWEYIRLIKFYNNSLFKMIKDYIPARSDLSTGIIVKSHMLERNRYARHEPSMSFQNYSQSIDMTYISGSTGGSINYTSSWSGYLMGPNGSFPYSSSKNIELYNGEFSGSYIVVSTGKAMNQDEYSNLSASGSYYPTMSLGALYQNITASVRSQFLFDLDYNSDQTKPVNYGIVTQSINNSQINNYNTYNNPNNPYSQTQDYNYFIKRSTIPRYEGSKTISNLYNTYTLGDSAYGKTAAIDKIKYQYAYLTNIYSSSFQLPGRTNAQIKYIIDNDQNVLDLSKLNTNIFEVQNIFKSGESVNISLFDYSPSTKTAGYLTNNSNVKIYEGGFSFSPILFNVDGTSQNIYTYLTPFVSSSIVSTPGGTDYDPPTINNRLGLWQASSTINQTYIPGYGSWVTYITLSSGSIGAVSETLRFTFKSYGFSSPYFGVTNYAYVTINVGTTPGTIGPIFAGYSNPSYFQVTIDNVESVTTTPGGTTTTNFYITGSRDSDSRLTAIDPLTIQLSATQSILYDSFIQSGSYPGLDPIVFPFSLNSGDMVRFYDSASGWSKSSEYRITSIYQFVTQSIPYYRFGLNKEISLSQTATGSYPAPISKYIFLKHQPDETNVILDYESAFEIQEDGILFPQYIGEGIQAGSGNVIKALKQQNLIP